jgi:hypothetical protein
MPPPPIPTKSKPEAGSPGPPPIPTKSKPEAGSPVPPSIPPKAQQDSAGASLGRTDSAHFSLQDLFSQIDRGGDGYITFSEFVRWWKSMDSQQKGHTLTDSILSEAMRKFHEQDLDGNGSIDIDELAPLLVALGLHKTVLEGEIDMAELGLEEEDAEDEADVDVKAEAEADDEKVPEPEPEPAAPEPKQKRLKMFYAKQQIFEGKPETIQLAVGNMSLMVMYHGETIETYPYIVLKNWGKTESTFWLRSCDDFATDEVNKYEFETTEGKKISDLMVTQAQEMAKLMRPGAQNKGSVGWEDLVYEVKIHTGALRGVHVGTRTIHLELMGDKGRSGKLKMPQTSDTKRVCFQRMQVDSFIIKLKSAASKVRAGHVPDFSSHTDNYAYMPSGVDEIGSLQKLKIGHDGKGTGSGWDVNKVVVVNVRTHEKVEFKVGRVLDKNAGPDPSVEVVVPDECGELIVLEDEDTTLEATAIEKESVIGTYRALRTGAMREDVEAQGEKVGMLTEGDIVECFEEKENAKGQKRMRVLSPAGVMGWVSFIAQDGTVIFKTTTSWGAYRENPEGDGCSGWMEKKGGMRTNWTKRWFHLKDLTLTYYETNKVGVGKAEKGKVRAGIAITPGRTGRPQA